MLYSAYSYWAVAFGYYAAVGKVGNEIDSLGGKTLPERVNTAGMYFFSSLSLFFSLAALHY